MADPTNNQTLQLPDLRQFALDLSQWHYKIGDDDEFVNKTEARDEYLQTFFSGYNAALAQYGQIIANYLEQAQDVPIAIRQQFEQLAADAQAALVQMRSLLASANLPALPGLPAGYMLRVNADSTGYEAVPPSTVTAGLLQQLSLHIENDFLQLRVGDQIIDSVSLAKYEEISDAGEYTYGSFSTVYSA